MYVAITKKRYKDKYYEQILLRESYREEGKVKTRTIANLTHQPKEQIKALKAILSKKNKDTLVFSKQYQGKSIGLSYIITHLMKKLNIIKSVESKKNPFASLTALCLIAARVSINSSRLQALSWIKKIDKIASLLNIKDEYIEKLNNKNIYKGLDYLYDNQELIENRLFKLNYKDKESLPKRLYYDVTSTYVEGDYEDSKLVSYGYNRDKKKGKKQIVIGLLTDEKGRALSVDVYPGNTNDIKTFDKQLKKAKKRFKIDNITIVGDGGMIKSSDIETIISMGYDYITTIPKDSIKKLINDKESKFNISLFDEKLNEIIENNIRYILRVNPIRRDEIRLNREAKIKRLKEFIEDKKGYYNSHYRAKRETLEKNIDNFLKKLKLDSFIDIKYLYKEEKIEYKNKNSKKELKVKEIAKEIEIVINQEKREEIEMLDGCYVIKTSLTNIDKDSKEEIHKAYKDLINVENAFKILKTEFLEIRPLYLKTDKRIKGHIFLSSLAYNIVFELKRYIKEADISFKETIALLKNIKTVINKIDNFTYETIPQITNEKLKRLFKVMNINFPYKCKQ